MKKNACNKFKHDLKEPIKISNLDTCFFFLREKGNRSYMVMGDVNSMFLEHRCVSA